MSEQLVRIRDREAIVKIREKGTRVLHRFGDKAVLAEALRTPVPGVTAERPTRFAVPERLAPEEIGELAFAYRQTRQFRNAKDRRPDEGVSMDKIIEGTVSRSE